MGKFPLGTIPLALGCHAPAPPILRGGFILPRHVRITATAILSFSAPWAVDSGARGWRRASFSAHARQARRTPFGSRMVLLAVSPGSAAAGLTGGGRSSGCQRRRSATAKGLRAHWIRATGVGANAAAIQAMGRDVASHWAIAGQRIDTAGWSGGARVATPVALGGLAKGVIAGSAGFLASGDGVPGTGSAGLAEAARGEAEPLFERLRNERADGTPWPNYGRIRRSRRDGGGADGAGGSATTPGLRPV